MGLEEQQEERDVLGSIYTEDEITDISDTAYRITITLEAPSSDESGIIPPPIWLSVSYPEAYPDVAPNLELMFPPNTAKYAFLDISEDKSQLLESLQSTIEESMGMPMVFSIASTLKDAAEVLIADRQRRAQEVRDLEVQKAEEEENRKFTGTAVTRERFLEWREKFYKEMEDKERQRKDEEEAEERKKRGSRADEKKLTGRQLWERGLGKEETEDGADLVDSVKELKVAS